MIAEVIVDIAHSDVDKVFDYNIKSDGILLGSRVEIPFGRQKTEGFVIGVKTNSDVPPDKRKDIIRSLDEFPVVSDEQLGLAHYIKDVYHVPFALALRQFIPAELRGGRVKERIISYAVLSEDKSPPLKFILMVASL